MLNLDTHILIFALTGELSKREIKLLMTRRWCISDIVLWELTKLSQLGRVSIDLTDSQIRSTISQVQVYPISIDVCSAMLELDFRADPADEIIAATSLAHRVPLLTRDKKMLKSKVVPLAL